ncbi:MAG TPA: hypothetical protein DCQ79_08480, partial [Rhizobiales bacterium]|nr:hypothetical protein [Hyphomicrobiales bacterium]
MLVTQDLLVGCMVALQYLAIGHGESHAPKDRGLQVAVAVADRRHRASTATGEWKSLETTSQSARSGLMTLNTKIAD